MKNGKIKAAPKTARELSVAARDAAMPDVKALVKKRGRRAVQGCLNHIREHERGLERLERAKREVARMERQLKP